MNTESFQTINTSGSRKNYFIISGIAVFFLGLIIVGGYIAYNYFRVTPQSLAEPSIKTYGDCVAATGSQLEGVNSEICTDHEGRRHFQEVIADFSPAPLAECPDKWGSEELPGTQEQTELIYYGENKVQMNEGLREWVIQNCVVRPQ